MFGLFFALVLGCFGPKTTTETGIVETALDTDSQITWEECSYRIGVWRAEL